MRDRIPVMNSIFRCVYFIFLFLLTALCLIMLVNQDIVPSWDLDKTAELLEMVWHCLVMIAVFYVIWKLEKLEKLEWIHKITGGAYMVPVVFGIILCLFFVFYGRLRYVFRWDAFKSNSILSAYMTMVYPLFIYLIYANIERINRKRLVQIIVAALIIISTLQSLINSTESPVLMMLMNIAPIAYCFVRDYRGIVDKKDRSAYKKKAKWLCLGYVLITALMSAVYYLSRIEHKDHFPNDGLLMADRLTIEPVKEVQGPRFIKLSYGAEMIMYIMIALLFIGLVCYSVRHLYMKKYGIINLSAALYFVVKMVLGFCFGFIDSSLLYGLYPFQYYDIAIDIVISVMLLYFTVIENTKIDMKMEMLNLCSPMKYFRSVGGEVGDSVEELLPFQYRFQLNDPLDYCFGYSEDVEIRFPHVRNDMRYIQERRFDLKKVYSMVYEGKEYILFKMYDIYGIRKLLVLSEAFPPKNGIATYSMEMDYIIVSNILSDYRNKLLKELSI